MPDDGLPKKLSFGQVKGCRLLGCPRSSLNDVAVHDCQLRRINKPYKDAQNKLLCTYLAYHEFESITVIIII